MTHVEIPLHMEAFGHESADRDVINDVLHTRQTAKKLIEEENYRDALERIVDSLRSLRDFTDFENIEFRAILLALLFDLAEIYFALKDYKKSERLLDLIFKMLDSMIKADAERFGKYHILAMELSTRILRSRKKTVDLLAKQQLTTSALYEKVNAGVVAATDKLVDSLRKVAQLLASSGDYKAALKFYAEAIKFSKRRAGRVTRKEVTMTIEMAEIMMRIRHMRQRAKRLLGAILPHAIALETIELEQNILSLLEVIDADIEHEPKWKNFIHKITLPIKKGRRKKETEQPEEPETEEPQK